jgi:hypothetical protein
VSVGECLANGELANVAQIDGAIAESFSDHIQIQRTANGCTVERAEISAAILSISPLSCAAIDPLTSRISRLPYIPLSLALLQTRSRIWSLAIVLVNSGLLEDGRVRAGGFLKFIKLI